MASRGAGNLSGPGRGFPPDKMHSDGGSGMSATLLRFLMWFEEVQLAMRESTTRREKERG